MGTLWIITPELSEKAVMLTRDRRLILKNWSGAEHRD